MSLTASHHSRPASTQKSYPLREMALVYVALAYETDQELSADETSAIAVGVGRWVPDSDERRVRGAIREAMSAYVQSADEHPFAKAVSEIDESMTAEEKNDLLNDLRRTAMADGKAIDSERRMIRDFASAWGLTNARQAS